MAEQGTLSFKQTGDATLEVHLTGAWRLRGGLPSAALIKRELESAPSLRHIGFEARALASWDSSVLVLTGEKASGNFLIEQAKLVASDVRGRVVKGSGHWLMEEARNTVIPAITDFIN